MSKVLYLSALSLSLFLEDNHNALQSTCSFLGRFFLMIYYMFMSSLSWRMHVFIIFLYIFFCIPRIFIFAYPWWIWLLQDQMQKRRRCSIFTWWIRYILISADQQCGWRWRHSGSEGKGFKNRMASNGQELGSELASQCWFKESASFLWDHC